LCEELCALLFKRWKRRISLLIKVKNSETNKMFGEIMKLRLLEPKNNLGKIHKRSSGIWELLFAKVVQFLHKNCSMDLK
jgi:hypothetical protein